MSKDTLIAKYETLPAVAQKQVETFIEFLSKTSAGEIRALREAPLQIRLGGRFGGFEGSVHRR
jgi:hypothetical protein